MQSAQTLTTEQFRRIAGIAKARWGLSLADNKVQLVANRLASFLRKSRHADVQAYLQHLELAADEQDMLIFFDLLSTNVTNFFRDRQHFDYLDRELFHPLAERRSASRGRKLRLWSAGCSIGCEPYTMAIVAHERLADVASVDVKILGTDLSNYAVSEARAGSYDRSAVKDLPHALLARHFDDRDDQFVVKPHLRQLVKIGQLNLMGSWPMRGPFDAIFCRNVMIYFDAPTRERLVRRLASLLRPGGILALGSAETLAGMDIALRSAMPSLYVK